MVECLFVTLLSSRRNNFYHTLEGIVSSQHSEVAEKLKHQYLNNIIKTFFGLFTRVDPYFLPHRTGQWGRVNYSKRFELVVGFRKAMIGRF